MTYQGRYSDGEAFRTVDVTLAPHGVSIERAPGLHDWWSFEQARIQKYDRGIRFEVEKAALDVTDPAFLDALARTNPRVARGQAPESNSEFALRLSLLAVVVCAALIGIIWAGVPLITSTMAKSVPVNVEESVGRSTVDAIAPASKRHEDPKLNQIVERLAKAAPVSPYTFKVFVLDDPAVNAFAAPGGYIVVCQGLLQQVKEPDEEAAVLAHEMEHVLQRHVVKALIRGISISAGFALLSGDASGAVSQVGATLSSLHYQRGDEWNADVQGYRLMKAAGMNPKAMISMLETLGRVQGEPQGIPYLSTHPSTKDRIARLHDVRE